MKKFLFITLLVLGLARPALGLTEYEALLSICNSLSLVGCVSEAPALRLIVGNQLSISYNDTWTEAPLLRAWCDDLTGNTNAVDLGYSETISLRCIVEQIEGTARPTYTESQLYTILSVEAPFSVSTDALLMGAGGGDYILMGGGDKILMGGS
jgi:hypothetical protein